jgi:hypothetical protein
MGIAYPSYVRQPVSCKICRLSYTDFASRLALTMKLTNAYNRHIVFILMNPSTAAHYDSDKTMNKIAHTSFVDLKELHIGSATVVNVYPFYQTKSSELQTTLTDLMGISKRFYYKQLFTNLREVYSAIAAADYVFLGTGGIPDHIQDKEEYNFLIHTIHSYVETLKGTALLGKGDKNKSYLKNGIYSYHLCPHGNPTTINKAHFYKLSNGRFIKDNSSTEFDISY